MNVLLLYKLHKDILDFLKKFLSLCILIMMKIHEPKEKLGIYIYLRYVESINLFLKYEEQFA
jgi:hypothetical protein